jgi:DNA-directed RNA polymerase II subunit RPB2
LEERRLNAGFDELKLFGFVVARGHIPVEIIEIEDINNNGTVKDFKNVAIGSIPIMLHSDICVLNNQGSEVLQKLGECVYDTGGYFIIDGKEKVIIAQERIVTNRLFVTKIKDDQTFSYKGLIRCTGDTGETMLSPRSVEFYLVKNPDVETEDDVVEDYRDKKGAIMVSLPSVTGKIPLFTFFRALGVECDKDICDCIFGSDISPVEKSFFDNFIRPSVCNNPYKIYNQEDALNYLRPLVKYKNLEHVKNILTTDVFPNIPIYYNKGRYLGYLVKQFINVAMQIAPPSDRDSYIYKRVDISGYLLAELFQEAYMRLRKFIRDKLDSMYYFGSWNQKNDYENFITEHNIYKLVPNLIVTKTFERSLKGMWGLADEEDPELGKVQDLARISYLGFMSHLRRVNMPLDRSIKVTAPHKLHPQQYGIMCPFETPDGASVGYMKNLAFLTKIASGSSAENIRKCLLDIGVIPIEYANLSLSRNTAKVFINGSWFGITENPAYILRILRAYRRNSLINILISISWHIKANEIRILTEAGRPCRPLIIAAHRDRLGKTLPTSWFDLIQGSTLDLTEKDKTDEFYYRNEYINPKTLSVFKNADDMDDILKILEINAAVIEYLDIEEEDTCLLAMHNNDIGAFHTHLEIHPGTMLSVVSANIPLSHHNQSARNVFHGAQSKQAIGIYATNFNQRFDTMAYVQHYPQRQIIGTRLSQYTCSSYMPNGFNVIAAIMTYTGSNQEDSILINKQSVERGLFHLSYYKSVTGTAKDVSQNERIVFGNPKHYVDRGIKVNGIKHANYSLLDDNGFIKEGSYVSKGQRAIIIGMINIREIYEPEKRGVFTEMVKKTVYTDVSLVTDEAVYGIVNKVFFSTKTVGNNSSVCKVRFLKIRTPELGDKLSSSHGQKGTVGMIIPEENMPFTKDGVKPDIIINPHAIPSRMTIGHLVEKVFSKLCCMKGCLGDGSVFIPFDEGKVYEELGKEGFESYGNEILYNGFNGQQLQTEIFIGPIFYMRLKHMVADKINVRGLDRDKSELPKVMLTRQPTAGKRKGGGLRIGEMERDSIISHGTSLFLQESMMERSDKYKWPICKNCGTMAIYNPNKKNRIVKCKNCGRENIALIQTPYSFKLLTQELQTMGIDMKLNTERLELPSTKADIDDVFEELFEGGQWDVEKYGKKQDGGIDEIEEVQMGSEGGAEDENDAEDDEPSDGGSEPDNISSVNTDSKGWGTDPDDANGQGSDTDQHDTDSVGSGTDPDGIVSEGSGTDPDDTSNEDGDGDGEEDEDDDLGGGNSASGFDENMETTGGDSDIKVVTIDI